MKSFYSNELLFYSSGLFVVAYEIVMLREKKMQTHIGLRKSAILSNSSSSRAGMSSFSTRNRKSQTQLGSMQVCNSQFSAFIENLTANTVSGRGC